METSGFTQTALSTEFLATIHRESCRLLKGRGPISCADKCAEHCESSSFGMARAHFLCMAGCETSFESQRDCAVRSSSLNCGNSRGAAVRKSPKIGARPTPALPGPTSRPIGSRRDHWTRSGAVGLGVPQLPRGARSVCTTLPHSCPLPP